MVLRGNATRLSGIVRLMKPIMTTMRTPLGEDLSGECGIEITKRAEKDRTEDEKM